MPDNTEQNLPVQVIAYQPAQLQRETKSQKHKRHEAACAGASVLQLPILSEDLQLTPEGPARGDLLRPWAGTARGGAGATTALGSPQPFL